MRKSGHNVIRSILILAVGASLWAAAHLLRASGDAAPRAAANTTLEAQAHAALSVINGKLKLSGLHHPVTVLRDRWGVPHIYAQDQHDLFFAQGFRRLAGPPFPNGTLEAVGARAAGGNSWTLDARTRRERAAPALSRGDGR